MGSLYLYAKTRDIRVTKLDIAGAAYSPQNRTVFISDEIDDDTTELTLLLHELGHSTDPNLYKMTRVTKAYHSLQAGKATGPQRRMIMKTEVRAWIAGRMIAGVLGIKLGSWYAKTMQENLRGYRTAL